MSPVNVYEDKVSSDMQASAFLVFIYDPWLLSDSSIGRL